MAPEERMPYREHPAVNTMQAAVRDAVTDPAGAEPERRELRERDDAVLARRALGDRAVQPGVFDVSCDIGTFRR
jgi:hypothetical protein